MRAYGGPAAMRDPLEIVESTAEMVERIKTLLRSVDDRLRVSRLQLERSRKLLERFDVLESDLKRRKERQHSR